MLRRTPARLLALLFAAASACPVVALPGRVDAAPPPGRIDAAQARRFLDRVVPEQLARLKIPGAVVGVVAAGQPVLTAGYGIADVATGRAVDPERTAFELGSIAKIFTATAVMQLVERGKVDLHADVNRYLRDVAVADTYPGRPVTTAHLLTHTSGFATFAVGTATARPVDASRLGPWLAAHQPRRVRPPGVLPAYDNYGTALAGHVVESVTGQPFPDYVRQHILQPLGMTGTSFDQPPQRPSASLATGHRWQDGRQIAATVRYGPMVPAGSGPVTTAVDMNAFALAQLTFGRLGNTRILDEGTARQLQQRHLAVDDRLSGLALLFEEQRHGTDRVLLKDGTTTGFHGKLVLVPQRGIGVYVAYNGLGDAGGARLAGRDLIEAFLDTFVPFTAPVAATAAGPVGQFAGTYRSTRTSEDITRIQSLFDNVTVRAGDDGTLSVSGAPDPDPAQHTRRFRQIAPRLFEQVDGSDRIAFRTDTRGRVTVLAAEREPSEAYQRLTPWQNPTLDRTLLVGALLVAASTVVGWPAVAAARQLRRREPSHRRPRWARITGYATWCATAGATACAGMLLLLLDDAQFEALVTGRSVLLWALPGVATGTAVLAVAALGGAVLGWRYAWWRRSGRVHLTVAAVAALSVPLILSRYGVTPW